MDCIALWISRCRHEKCVSTDDKNSSLDNQQSFMSSSVGCLSSLMSSGLHHPNRPETETWAEHWICKHLKTHDVRHGSSPLIWLIREGTSRKEDLSNWLHYDNTDCLSKMIQCKGGIHLISFSFSHQLSEQNRKLICELVVYHLSSYVCSQRTDHLNY